MCKISVIIPIYKVERFLAECLESVQKQTFSDYEVIMVDDGSPDGSAEICRRFAAQDARFRLLQQPNGGVTAARRAGVAQAHGEYMMFVDGDDTLPPDAMDVLLRNMNDEVDIVVGQPDVAQYVTESKCVSPAEYRRQVIHGILDLSMWARLFRRCLFDDSVFDMSRNILTGEDWISNLRLAFHTQKQVSLIADVVYNYRMNEAGISQTMQRTVEYEKMVYDELCHSIPEHERAVYVPIVAAAYAPIWVKYSKHQVKLSPIAEAFRKHMIENMGAKIQTLRLQDRLFLQFTNPMLRRVIIMLSIINGQLHGLLSRLQTLRL